MTLSVQAAQNNLYVGGEGRQGGDILGQVALSKDYYMRGATLPRIQAGSVFSCIFSCWDGEGEIIVANTMQLTGVGCQ